jgi:drug/metabolite transporter (DMT)-like permease
MAPARAGVLAIVVATLLWGATFVVIRDSVHALTPAQLVFGRFAAAAALLGGLVLVRRRRIEARSVWGGVAGGASMAGGYFFQAVGLTETSAGSSAFLTCAGTLFAGLWAWLLLRQRPGGALLTGIAVAMAGAALVSLDRSLQLGRGELYTLLGAMLFALQIVALARFAPRADALALTAVQVATVALMVAPSAVPGLPAAFARLDGAGWARFAYLVVAGSVIAPFLQVWAQGSVPAGRTGLLFALEPVFALSFAATIGGERFVARWWAGAALILAAIAWVELRPSGPAAPTFPPSTGGSAGTPGGRSGTA